MRLPSLVGQTVLIAGNRFAKDTPLAKRLCAAGCRVVHSGRGVHMIQAIELHTPDLVIIDAERELWQAIESLWALQIEEKDTLPFIVVHADEEPSFNDLLYLNEAALPLNGRGLFTSQQTEQVLRVIWQLTQETELQVPISVEPKLPVSSQPTRTRRQPTTRQPWWATYNPSINTIRGMMVLAIVFLVALSALSAMFFPTGVVVFEKILPILTLSAGYLFGRQGDHESPSPLGGPP